jgi:hypothetical protein
VEEGPEGDGELAANAVRNGGGNQGTNHSTDGELERVLAGCSVCETEYTYQSDNETVANVGEGIFTGSGVVLSEAALEVTHGSETRDLT